MQTVGFSQELNFYQRGCHEHPGETYQARLGMLALAKELKNISQNRTTQAGRCGDVAEPLFVLRVQEVVV